MVRNFASLLLGIDIFCDAPYQDQIAPPPPTFGTSSMRSLILASVCSHPSLFKMALLLGIDMLDARNQLLLFVRVAPRLRPSPSQSISSGEKEL